MFITVKDMISPLVSNSVMLVIGIVMKGSMEYVPKKNILTDIGFWVKRAGAYADIEKSKMPFQKLISWDEVFII